MSEGLPEKLKMFSSSDVPDSVKGSEIERHFMRLQILGPY
jgi:hypothetical protein